MSQSHCRIVLNTATTFICVIETKAVYKPRIGPHTISCGYNSRKTNKIWVRLVRRPYGEISYLILHMGWHDLWNVYVTLIFWAYFLHSCGEN